MCQSLQGHNREVTKVKTLAVALNELIMDEYHTLVSFVRVCAFMRVYPPPSLPGGVFPRQYLDLQCVQGQECGDVGPQPRGRAHPGVLWSRAGGQRTGRQPR